MIGMYQVRNLIINMLILKDDEKGKIPLIEHSHLNSLIFNQVRKFSRYYNKLLFFIIFYSSV